MFAVHCGTNPAASMWCLICCLQLDTMRGGIPRNVAMWAIVPSLNPLSMKAE